MSKIVRRSILRGLGGKRWLGTLAVASAVMACGGTSFSGGNGSNVNEGSGGEPGDSGSLGGSSSGGGSVGGGPHGGAMNGGAPNGGAGGIREGTGGNFGGGGAICACTAIGCGPGYHSVSIPGQCCPSCEPCTVDCPAIPCGLNQQPVTLPGQCCATSCADVTPVCTKGTTPSCLSSGQCTATWSQAIAAFGTCDPPPIIARYLATCGQYHAIIDQSIDTSNDGYTGLPLAVRYLYDASGALVGNDSSISHDGVTRYSCEAYDPSFVPPTIPCVFDSQCGGVVSADAGPASYCGDGVIGQGEACDGLNLAARTCLSATQGKFTSGTLKCSANCQFDISGCAP